jgi:hypothetical protein
MKTAGDILSALFDEGFVKKAHEYSKLFNSWADITAKNGIASAADHSRIKELDRGILLVEMDHPGWKQILQTKQGKLLNDFRRRFPELDISGISLMLGKSEPQIADSDGMAETETSSPQPVAEPASPENRTINIEESSNLEPEVRGYDAIKDEAFRETLVKLGQTISDREKSK